MAESYLAEYMQYLDLGYEHQIKNNYRRDDSFDFIASHLVELWEELSPTEQKAAQQYSDKLYADYRRNHKKELITA